MKGTRRRTAPVIALIYTARKVHHWFAGLFWISRSIVELTLRICMAGHDTPWNKATVAKWQGLYPLLSYADPMRYETYEWFHRRADGQWMSGALDKGEEERLGGSGPCPVQQVVPPELATQFLSDDGAYWNAWRELRATTVYPETNHFEIRHRFDVPTAAIAMHPPYTYTYLQQFLARLQAREFPGVFLDEIGDTAAGRKLTVIRVEDPRHPLPERNGGWFREPASTAQMQSTKISSRHTLLVTAREHGTEHSSSWVVQGILRALLSGARRPNACVTTPPGCWCRCSIRTPASTRSSIRFPPISIATVPGRCRGDSRLCGLSALVHQPRLSPACRSLFLQPGMS